MVILQFPFLYSRVNFLLLIVVYFAFEVLVSFFHNNFSGMSVYPIYFQLILVINQKKTNKNYEPSFVNSYPSSLSSKTRKEQNPSLLATPRVFYPAQVKSVKIA